MASHVALQSICGDVLNRENDTPLYQQVAEVLRERIRLGQFDPRQPMPTQRDLVARFNVSPATVREAMRMLASEGLIVGEQGRGTFVRPNVAGELNHSGRTKHGRIALVMPWSLGSFFAPMVGAIEDVIESRNLRAVLINSRNDATMEMTRVRDLMSEGIDGLLWMCPDEKPNARFFRQVAAKIPVVAIDRTYDGDDETISLVEADNYGGMRRVVEHLLSIGRRRIALVRKPTPQSSVERRGKGYEVALRDAGITPCEDWVFESRSREDQRFITRMLDAEKPFDAVACETDDLAVGVIHALRERGVRIPEDVAVTGFDDSSVTTTIRPQMTSVYFDVELLGRRAAELLLDQIEKHDAGDPVERVRISIPTRVVPRESTVGKSSGSTPTITETTSA